VLDAETQGDDYEEFMIKAADQVNDLLLALLDEIE
jgi:hypothetical protein